MELEFFCEPDTDLEWHAYWKKFCLDWLKTLGIKDEEMRYRDHSPEELSHYSKATTDVEFLFPFGWGELWGIADRTDFDLTQHQNVSKQDLSYFDDEKKIKYIPYVIEPSLGADRMVLAFLCSAYDEEELEGGDMRTVLHFPSGAGSGQDRCAAAVQEAERGGQRKFTQNCPKSTTVSSMSAAISENATAARTRSETPFCITYDFESEEDGAVTVRDRDTMEQERVKIEDLESYFEKKFEW